MSPTSHNMTKPFVVVKSYEMIDYSEDGFTTLMDGAGSVCDIALPNENSQDPLLAAKIINAMDTGKNVSVTVTYAMDKEAITGFKIMKEE